MKKGFLRIVSLCMVLCFLLAGCGPAEAGDSSGRTAEQSAEAVQENAGTEEKTEAADSSGSPAEQNDKAESEEPEAMPQMKIGETPVDVEWENNASVEALKELCKDGPLSIQMSMYGGFEQVGPIGQNLPREDRQTTTQAGDIVLYSGNQMVVFYGTNSWAYTRLGHITDKSGQELADLLGNGDVTITIERGQ